MIEDLDTLEPARARLLTLLRSCGSRDAAGWLPLTATQQGIWLGEQLDPGESGYHDTAVLRFTGRLDVDALHDAFSETQATHEALRARIIEVDGEPRQTFDVDRLIWVYDDLAENQSAAQAEADRWAVRDAATPFDLERGPLWRVRVMRLGGDEHRVVIVLHHLVTDGWSHGVVLRAALAHYLRITGVAGPPPPVPARSYASWVTAKVRLEAAAVSGRQLDDVIRRLADAPRVWSFPGLAGGTSRAAGSVPVPVPTEVWSPFGSACQRVGATGYMALGGLFALLLARAGGVSPVVMSAPVAKRCRAADADLVGCMIDVVPVRIDVPAAAAPADAVSAGRAGVVEALRHGEVPYRQVARALGADASSDDPLTNIGLEEFNAPRRGRRVGPLRVEPLSRGLLRLRHDLTLSLASNVGDGVALLYPADRWRPGAVEALAADLAVLVSAFAA